MIMSETFIGGAVSFDLLFYWENEKRKLYYFDLLWISFYNKLQQINNK